MIKRYIISYLITVIISAISIAIGLLTITNQDVKLLFTLVFPVLSFFAADKITSLLQSQSENNELALKIIASIPSSDTFLLIKNSNIAFEYIYNSIDHAVDIKNTRISINPVKESYVSKKQKMTDDKIKTLLKKGVNYSNVVSQKYTDSISDFHKFAKQHKTEGQFRGNILGNVNFPVINFMVIDYAHSKELLMGWAVASNWDHTRPVFLIREKNIVEYFEILHEQLLSK